MANKTISFEQWCKKIQREDLFDEWNEDKNGHDDSDVEIERVHFNRVQSEPVQYQQPKRKSFWQRIKDFFFEQ